MKKPYVVIIAGSASDDNHIQKIANGLRHFEIDYVIRIASAHKTADHAISLLKQYEADERPKIYITVAGRSNALSGFVDGYVNAPVIACPPHSDSFGGADIYSSIRMPSGISPAVVLDPENAALLAARILSLFLDDIAYKVSAFKKKQQQAILTADDRYANQDT